MGLIGPTLSPLPTTLHCTNTRNPHLFRESVGLYLSICLFFVVLVFMPGIDPTTLHGSRGILVLENAPPFTTNSPRDPPRIPQAHGPAAPRRSRSSPARLDIEDAAALCQELRRGMGDCQGREGAHLCPLAESAGLYRPAGEEAPHLRPQSGPSGRPGDVSMSPDAMADSPDFNDGRRALQL